MPLDLIPLEKGSRHLPLGDGDRGFLINLTKARWNNKACNEAIKLLRNFTQLYYETKCPDEQQEVKTETEEEKLPEMEDLGLDDNQTDNQADKQPDNQPTPARKEDKSGIDFAVREVNYPNVGFVACNLADPSDFAHFALTKLADVNDYKKPKLPFRILPIQRVCKARPKAVEQNVIPLLEETLGKDEFPYRFSLIYRSHWGGQALSQNEAKTVVRNCVWSLNPNCVQCIKYQDYAIVMDILDPFFIVGVARDFQKLASYNTWIIRQGIKPDPGTDSEDEISDDPALDEEEEKKRKLRIKRKRRAEKAGLEQPDDGVKREVKDEDDDEDGDGGEDCVEGNEDDGDDDVAGALNGDQD